MVAKKTDEQLHKMYVALLRESGFRGSNYEWNPDFPPLPKFGKKEDGTTYDEYVKLVDKIKKVVKKFNEELFHKTHCVELKRRIHHDKVFKHYR